MDFNIQNEYQNEVNKISDICRNLKADSINERPNYQKCLVRHFRQKLNCNEKQLQELVASTNFDKDCPVQDTNDIYSENDYVNCEHLDQYSQLKERYPDATINLKNAINKNIEHKINVFNHGCRNPKDYYRDLHSFFEDVRCAKNLVISYCKNDIDCEKELFNKDIMGRCVPIEYSTQFDHKQEMMHNKFTELVSDIAYNWKSGSRPEISVKIDTTNSDKEILLNSDQLKTIETRKKLEEESRRRLEDDIRSQNDEERRRIEYVRKRAEDEAARKRIQEEAERRRIENEHKRAVDEAERRRIEDEAARKRIQEEAERRRIEDEHKRAVDERKRIQEEAERKRVQEETERKRIEDERKRVKDEAERRIDDERKRVEAENERKRVEAERRIDDESKRVEAENERKRAEDERKRINLTTNSTLEENEQGEVIKEISTEFINIPSISTETNQMPNFIPNEKFNIPFNSTISSTFAKNISSTNNDLNFTNISSGSRNTCSINQNDIAIASSIQVIFVLICFSQIWMHKKRFKGRRLIISIFLMLIAIMISIFGILKI